ncbi:MAG: hypothetical protein FJ040_01090 [Chloroflexi bacterium]|nr:hypothetical protein [Chloroflexota bacterium]
MYYYSIIISSHLSPKSHTTHSTLSTSGECIHRFTAGVHRRYSMWRRLLVGAILVFGVLQVIPVHRTNPPVVNAVVFADPQAERIAQIACYDCHTNDNQWPWYSYVAPVS